ncbi:MAG TPA: helix-hairpin-helix domain-containing protein, partial [Polyangia bacterium]|nr:helix-hairpin-helix domain-containing protein [Polyangia bacterium]
MRGDPLSFAAVSIAALAVAAAAAPAYAGKGVDGVVNLNTAPAAVLALLPGVGPAKAEAIVGYRSRRPFRTVDELVRIKGIGRKMVRRLRPHLAVAGPTTAAAALITATTAPAPTAAPAIPLPHARPPPAPVRCPPIAEGPPRRPRGE